LISDRILHLFGYDKVPSIPDERVHDEAWTWTWPCGLRFSRQTCSWRIFRRLDASAVVRCACACKQWPRAITGNASSLHPRPDRFNPSLLLGFFQHYRHRERILDVRLRRAPGPFQSALPEAAWERLCSLMPSASADDIYIDRLS
jgi:hypothetical protein